MLLFPLDFLAVLFIMLGCEFGGDFAVEYGKFGFQRFQFILLTPRLCDDGFEQRHILPHLLDMFLILAYDFGKTLQSVDKVYAGGFCFAHGDKAVVVSVLVLALHNKAVLYRLLAVTSARSEIMEIGKP